MKHSETAGRPVLISEIDLASVAVVDKFNQFEGAELQLLQGSHAPPVSSRED